MRVHDSQAYRKIGVIRERISRILELREILLSIQTVFSLVNAAVACAIRESISGLEPSSVITEPRYLKLVKDTQSGVKDTQSGVKDTSQGLKAYSQRLKVHSQGLKAQSRGLKVHN